MKISELGEFGLINLLAAITGEAGSKDSPARRNLIIGIGDDAAAWRGDTSIQLATTDALVQDIHFNLDFITWEELGWRALAVNLSDIAAMGGLPRYILVSLSLPGSTAVESITDLYKGMTGLARESGSIIIGGNISEAPMLVINITVFGTAGSSKRSILTRSSALPGDKIAVTGYLGASAGGLEILRDKKKFDSESTAILKQAFLKPVPRIAEGQILVDLGVKTAIDISDGLLADLGHICEESKAGASIKTNLVPVHPAVKSNFGGKALKMALSGGEDYELLFTASEDIISRVKKALSCPVTVIGEITGENPGSVILVDENGNRIKPLETGWKHFSHEK